MTQILTTIEQASPDWLTDVLRRNGALPSGAVTTIAISGVHTDQIFSLGYFFHVFYTVSAPDTAPTHLFLKLPRPNSEPAVIVSRCAPEVRMYQALARDQNTLPVIPCYDAVYDSEEPAYHLLLADLSTTHVQPADYRRIDDYHIQQTVDSLSLFHAYLWEHPRLGRDVGDLPDSAVLAASCERLRAAFPSFADVLGDELGSEERHIYERVLFSLDCWLNGGPSSFWRLFVNPPLEAYRQMACGDVLG